jgi:hypothetical protein
MTVAFNSQDLQRVRKTTDFAEYESTDRTLVGAADQDREKFKNEVVTTTKENN